MPGFLTALWSTVRAAPGDAVSVSVGTGELGGQARKDIEAVLKFAELQARAGPMAAAAAGLVAAWESDH